MIQKLIKKFKIIWYEITNKLISIYLQKWMFDDIWLKLNNSEVLLQKVASHSDAQAFAKNVFPVPGGPYSKIPFQGCLNYNI